MRSMPPLDVAGRDRCGMQESWAGSMDCQGEAKSGILPPHASWSFNVHFIVVPSCMCFRGARKELPRMRMGGNCGVSRPKPGGFHRW